MEHGDEQERPQDEPAVRTARESWVERYLGDGWTEVEPGIYRFTPPGDSAAPDTSPSQPAETPTDDLADALNPAKPYEPPRRPFTRWRVRR